MIDVSSVKEIVSRWYPADYKMPRPKRQTHRVMEDIRESIDELKFYRSRVFIKP
jgi:oligoribonuclease